VKKVVFFAIVTMVIFQFDLLYVLQYHLENTPFFKNFLQDVEP